ncbi:hypothetical protein KFK09_013457 [Dendrobium nobile]|uniref:Uncharacterized protein n=1 Tax=Dendrobium nobile TaxID=94219 RepID=A0A8T3B8W5_DENNO|nr:hypothetical protein KFK09_013457 [Dendrobium nobile]
MRRLRSVVSVCYIPKIHHCIAFRQQIAVVDELLVIGTTMHILYSFASFGSQFVSPNDINMIY